MFLAWRHVVHPVFHHGCRIGHLGTSTNCNQKGGAEGNGDPFHKKSFTKCTKSIALSLESNHTRYGGICTFLFDGHNNASYFVFITGWIIHSRSMSKWFKKILVLLP